MIRQPRSLSTAPVSGAAAIRLLPFRSFATALSCADSFNIDRRGIAERERCISLLGAADVIEHPVRKATWLPHLFDEDADLVALRSQYSPAFRSAAASAVRAYISRDFVAALRLFGEAAAVLAAELPRDVTLLEEGVCLDSASLCVLSIMVASGVPLTRSFQRSLALRPPSVAVP
jgi:hypothetical protein